MSKPEIKGRGFLQSGKEIYEFQSYWTEKEKDFLLRNGKTMSDSGKSTKGKDESLEEKLKGAEGDPEKQELIRSLEGDVTTGEVDQPKAELPKRDDPTAVRKEGQEENQKHHDELVRSMEEQRKKNTAGKQSAKEDTLPSLGGERTVEHGGRIPRQRKETTERPGGKNPVTIQPSKPLLDEEGNQFPKHEIKGGSTMLPPPPATGGALELESLFGAKQVSTGMVTVPSQGKTKSLHLNLGNSGMQHGQSGGRMKLKLSTVQQVQPQQTVRQPIVQNQEEEDDPFNIVT